MASTPSFATLRWFHNRSELSASLVRRTSAGLSSTSRISTGPNSAALVFCSVMLRPLPVAWCLHRPTHSLAKPLIQWLSGPRRVLRSPTIGYLSNGAQRRNVANGHGFTAGPYYAERFPSGEQPAHGKQRGAGHLRQLFARNADFDGAVDPPAYPFLQSQELPGDPLTNFLGCHFTKSLFEFLQVSAEDSRHVLVQNRVAFHQGFESECIPDECPARPKGLRRCTVPASREQVRPTQDVAGHTEPEDYLHTAHSKLADFREARGEH